MKSSKLFALALLLTLSLGQCRAESSSSALACGLGIQWIEEESGMPSTWTRRGQSNIFDAVYPTAHVTTVNRVIVSGNRVHVQRGGGSDGNKCSYEGVVGGDGRSITGSYSCLNGSSTWKATVVCGAAK